MIAINNDKTYSYTTLMSSNEKSENFNPPAIYSKVLTAELMNVDYINDLAFSRISKKKNHQFLPYDSNMLKKSTLMGH